MQQTQKWAETKGSEPTRQALVDAGERLYALHGINGTNLLAIAREAGQANKYAVQYHFGDREGLLAAILESRAVLLESSRAAKFSTLSKEPSVLDLIKVIMLPLAELTDAAGKRTYARFLLHFMAQLEPWPHIRHPLRDPNPNFPTLALVCRELVAMVPQLDRETLLRRIDWLFRAFLGVLTDFDNRPPDRRGDALLRTHTADFLNMCVEALKA